MSVIRRSPLVNGQKTTRWTVERGPATVEIHLTRHGENNYFTISYWMDGKRKGQVFPTLQKAKDEAAQITSGDLGAANLTNADGAAHARAVALLKLLGVPLEFAESEYGGAIKHEIDAVPVARDGAGDARRGNSS